MFTDVDKIKSKAIELFDTGKALKEKMDQFEEWDSLQEFNENVTEAKLFFLEVILAIEEAVENLNKDIVDIKSGDKLAAAVEVIDERIELPWYLESFDGALIEMGINAGVKYLNDKFGENWDLDAVKKYIEDAKKLAE